VRQVQQALVRNGFQLTVDGFFGQRQKKQLKHFNNRNNCNRSMASFDLPRWRRWDSHLPKGKLTSIILKTSKKQNARRICTMLVQPYVYFDGFDHTSPQLRDEVMELQELLNAKGIAVVIDGFFGQATEMAVKQFQRSRGLDDDGIVGPLTWAGLIRRATFPILNLCLPRQLLAMMLPCSDN
jgi:hypothetical protein